MSQMKSNGRVELPVAVLELARRDFVSECISDELVRYVVHSISSRLEFCLTQTLETIRSHFEAAPSYVADPHTAVALAAAQIVASYKYV